jgi:hypothetical protein
MDDPEETREQAVRCRIFWMCVEHPELRRLIGSGPGQVPLDRLVEILIENEEEANNGATKQK